MTTLVTGATGFVGSHLARLLVARGDHVRVLVRPASRLQALEGLPVDIVYGDLRDPRSLETAARGVGRVFHAAADYRLWSRNPHEIYDSNVAGTRNLLDVCRSLPIERFVYTSSVSTIAVPRPSTRHLAPRSGHGELIEPRTGALPNENTVAALDEMIGDYKKSKFIAEQDVLAAAAGGLPVVIVNPTTPVGAGDWKPTPTGRIIVDFLRGRMVAYVHTGLNLVPVEDVAQGHLLAAEQGQIGKRYILGGQNLLLKEIFQILARITGRPAPVLRIPHAVAMAAGYGSEFLARVRGKEPGVPVDSVRMARHEMFVDDSRARAELGFQASSVDAALERAVRWYVDHGYVSRPS